MPIDLNAVTKIGSRLSVWFGFSIVLALIVSSCGGSQATATPIPPTRAAQTATATPAVATAISATPRPSPAATLAPTTPPATATPATAQPKRGGTIQARFGSASGGDTFDTYNPKSQYQFVYANNWINYLVTLDFDDPSIIRPDLAQSWEVSKDGTSVVLHLARGVAWHDGTPFSSKDVLYNLNSGWKPADPNRTAMKLLFARVTNIEAPDDATVRITLDRASASFLPNLTNPSLLMFPSHIPNIADWEKSRVGTGPFRFKSFSRDTAIESVKNPTYWKKDAAGGSLPYLDGITHNSMTTDLALAAFRSGKLDCGCSFDTDFMSPNKDQLLRVLPDWKPIYYYAIAYMYFNQKAPLLDKRARQAILIGLDRKRFADGNQGGFNYYPPFFFYQPDLKGQWGLPESQITSLPGWRKDHAADVALAKQLLRDAGVAPSQETVLQSTAFYADAGPLLDADLRDLGFNNKLVIPSTTADGVQQKQRGDFSFSFETPAPSIDDPSAYFGNLVVTGGATNYGKWSNATVDRLFANIETELDPRKRRDLAAQLQRELLDWAVIAPVAYVGRAQGPRGYVKGWNHAKFLSIDAAGRLEVVWLDR